MCCGSCLLLIWALFVALITPAIYDSHCGQPTEFSSAFEFGKMWAFTRDNLGNVIVAMLAGHVVAGLIASFVGTLGFVALCIGAIVTIPFADAVAVPGAGAPVRPDREVQRDAD